MNFENRIQKFHSLLTDNDKKIATYLLAHKDDNIINYTITDLSEEIYVSPASITRFCKKLKFNSFQELKYAILKDVSKKDHHVSTSHIIFGYYEAIIQSTLQFITEAQIKKITDMMKQANKIIFCGIGNSGMIAQEFNSRIERMGISSQSITDSHGMILKSSLLGKQDLLVCISYSGETQSIVDAAKLANANGTSVIAITNYEDTKLAKLSDEIVLISSYLYMDDEKFINTQVSSLFILDILTYELLNDDKLLHNRRKTLDAINKYG